VELVSGCSVNWEENWKTLSQSWFYFPTTLLTILTISILFKKPLTSILLTLLPFDEKKQRNLKLKMGHFELESQVVAKVQERAEAIALLERVRGSKDLKKVDTPQ